MDCLEGMKRIDQSPLEEIPIDRQKRAKKMLRGLTYQEVTKVSKAASALFLFVSLAVTIRDHPTPTIRAGKKFEGY